MARAHGTLEDETLEQQILARDRHPPLTEEERTAFQAVEVARSDWGPVFVYGQMLSQQAWCALIGHVPDMRPCWLRGWERREIICCPFAGLVKNEEDRDMLTVGQAIIGLLPWERRLLDDVVDDGFELIDAIIQPLDALKENLECTTYVWRQSKFPDAVGSGDWSQERFNSDYEHDFTEMCADLFQSYRTSKVSDDELKEMALRRRREQTGFEDEEEWKPDEEGGGDEDEDFGEENES